MVKVLWWFLKNYHYFDIFRSCGDISLQAPRPKLKKYYFDFNNLDKLKAPTICNNYFQPKRGLLTLENISSPHHLWMWSYMMFSSHHAAYIVFWQSFHVRSILEGKKKPASKFFPNDFQYTSKWDASNW
jgi:hypothetical protein